MKNGTVTIWMNLTGFEKTDEDRGVERFLDGVGFVPEAITGLFCHSDFFHLHRGMDEEYVLPPDNCSYWGSPRNLERERQDWTNYDVKKLTSELHKRGIEFYASVFGTVTGNAYHREWITDHPEIHRHCLRNSNNKANHFILKRFKDGSYYEDFFIKRVCETLADYGMDGVHLADSLCPPAGGMLHNLDFSSDYVSQFLDFSGIKLPDELAEKLRLETEEVERERGEWIYRERRLEWIEFNAWRWESFIKKLATALHAIGKKLLVLGMYCTDPFESLYCIGISLRRLVKAGVDKITANLLPTGCYIMGPDFRLYYFYKYMALAPTVAAHLPKGHLVSMLGVQDSTEEWSAIHHAPVMHERDMYTMMAYHLVDRDGISRALEGYFLCLGDGLSRTDWEWERTRIETALTPTPKRIFAPMMLWSEHANETLLPDYVKTRRHTPHKLFYELSKHGKFLGGTILPEAVNSYTGPLFVPNFDLLTPEEQRTVADYRGGAVIATACPDFDFTAYGILPEITFEDNFSDYKTRAVMFGGEISPEVRERVRNLLSEDDGEPNLEGDLQNLPEPNYTLTDTLVFAKLNRGFVDAIALLFDSQDASPFRINKPSIVMQMPSGAYRLYLFNDSEIKYHRAFVLPEREVKSTAFVTKYPVLPPKFMDAPSTDLHYVYKKDSPRRGFEVKITPGGVTVMDVVLES